MVIWRLVGVFLLVATSLAQAENEKAEEHFFPYWTQWLSYCISKGVYIVLISLITICVAVTGIKNKFGENIEVRPSWLNCIWKAVSGSSDNSLFNSLTPCYQSYGKHYEIESSIPDGVRKELIEARNTMALLRSELEETKVSKQDLEETLSLMRSATSDQDSNSELRKLYDQTQRELKKVTAERDKLVVEKDNYERDARIATSAMNDLHLSEVRLNEANIEIQNLKRQMSYLKKEKDTIYKILNKIKEASKPPVPLVSQRPRSSSSKRDESGDYDVEMLMNLAEDVGMPCDSSMMYILNSNDEMLSSLVENIGSLSDDGQEVRPVTQSVIFRRFLERNFPRQFTTSDPD